MEDQIEWKQIFPDKSYGDYTVDAVLPGRRDVWGGSFAYGSSLYVFGGAYEEFGPSRKHGDLSTMGVLNDLWRYNTLSKKWVQLHANDGSRNYTSSARYPGARVLPSLSVVGSCAYLFGGLTVIEKDFVTRALNDLWRYDIEKNQWEQIHPDTGVVTYDSRPTYPSCRCASLTVVAETSIYIFGGWPGIVPVFLLNDFWRYDSLTDCWEQIHTHNGSYHRSVGAVYPGTRYCAASGMYDNCIYLFSGRESIRKPEFFNDLWRYEIRSDNWVLLHPDDQIKNFGASATYPAGRYAGAFTMMDSKLFLFGGYNGGNTERNDFWSYDMATNHWQLLHADNGNQDYSEGAEYPGIRRVATMQTVGKKLLLFGGLNLFAGSAGNSFVKALNDLWEFD